MLPEAALSLSERASMHPTRSHHDPSNTREESRILRIAADLARLSAELDGLSAPAGGANSVALEDARYAVHRAAVALGELLSSTTRGPDPAPSLPA